jgi:hypothetical protein
MKDVEKHKKRMERVIETIEAPKKTQKKKKLLSEGTMFTISHTMLHMCILEYFTCL